MSLCISSNAAARQHEYVLNEPPTSNLMKTTGLDSAMSFLFQGTLTNPKCLGSQRELSWHQKEQPWLDQQRTLA